MSGRIKVLRESPTGRNTKFKDTKSRQTMTRSQFVSAITSGKYEKYHVRTVNGVKTPVSNPDKSSKNNLG